MDAKRIVVKVGSSTLTGDAGTSLNGSAVTKLVDVVAILKGQGKEVIIVTSAAIAAALAQDRTFKEQVARPAQRNLEKMINKIVREKTDIVDFKFNELTLTDEIAQSQILERYIKTQIMVPNEARTILGMPQRDGGDDPVVAKPEAANNPADRERDAERTNNQSDGSATIAGRNPKGEGRSSQ